MNPYAARLSDFSSFVFEQSQLGGLACSWKSFFKSRLSASPKKIILEIGCSNGLFLNELARRNPDLAFVGVDWKFKGIYKAARRADALGLKNIAYLRSHARALREAFGPEELDEVWIFFPDPWAKKAQLKHRLFQEEFLSELGAALKPGARLHFKTDHPGYFQWAAAVMGESPPPLPADLYASAGTEPQTRSKKARQVRVRRLEDQDELPPASQLLRDTYSVESILADYWSPAHAERRPPALFQDLQTVFEKRFFEERLPIYYLQLAKKQRRP